MIQTLQFPIKHLTIYLLLGNLKFSFSHVHMNQYYFRIKDQFIDVFVDPEKILSCMQIIGWISIHQRTWLKTKSLEYIQNHHKAGIDHKNTGGNYLEG